MGISTNSEGDMKFVNNGGCCITTIKTTFDVFSDIGVWK